MRNPMSKAGLSLFVVMILTEVAGAQPVAPGGGVGGTGVSPYLNLLRNNTNNANPAFNYLTITRPQLQLAQQANQLNQNLQMTNQQLMNQQAQGGVIILGGDNAQPVTGHRTTFGNVGSHFNNIGGGAGGGIRMGAGFGMMNGGIGQGFQPGAGRMGGGGGMGAAMGARGVPGVGGFGAGGIRR